MAIIPTAKIFSESEWVEFINYHAVSSRQAEVIKRLLSGLADKQIALIITPNVLLLILVLVSVAVATPMARAACPTYQTLGRRASDNKPNVQLRRTITLLDPFALKSYKAEGTSFLSIDTLGMKSGSTTMRHRILIPSRPAVRSVFKLSLLLCSRIDSRE